MAGKRKDGVDSHTGHWERLRQRFQQNGLSGFHDYEVVELLLTLARAQGDTKDSGKAAIKKFGSVRGVLDASPADLELIDGIGPSSAFVVKLVRELAEYYYRERMQQDKSPLDNSQAVADYLRVSMGSLDREVFRVVYLDTQNRPVTVEELFRGTLNSSVVYPREILKGAIKHNAAAVILAHNHPSGCVDPSPDDRRITSELVLAASYVDLVVLDHIVVGASTHFSFADHGLIKEYRKRAMDFHESRRVA